MGSMDLRPQQRQAQVISPRMQHAVRLLQMSSQDFAAVVQDALGQNPFLEVEEGGERSEGPGAAGEAPAREEFDASASAMSDTYGDAVADSAADADMDDRAFWQAEPGATLRGAGDMDLSFADSVATETRLNTHLHAQLQYLPLAARELLLARTIVESLDDDGYLRTPLAELVAVAGASGVAPPPALLELHAALRCVQALEPAGVGARSVAECLQLQLPAIQCPALRALAQTVLTEHLPLLAARDVAGLARKLGQPNAQVQAVCDRIRRLDPRPGWRHGAQHTAYVVPDVLVKKVRGQWRVQLNPAVVPRVRLNQACAELFERHRAPQHQAMAEHLQQARWTLRNVQQRLATILGVAEAIVQRQRHFLEYGAMAMKPMGLREIAAEVGVHESTVSRVTNNKYMATPTGVFELKHFFSRAMVSASGNACSGTAIRGLVKDTIEAECAQAPLSDAEIARQLAQQGLCVARRTVTKYRQLLRIDAVERRRRLA